MDTLKQTRATKIQRREDVEWVCGDCSAYIGFLHASLACLHQKFWHWNQAEHLCTCSKLYNVPQWPVTWCSPWGPSQVDVLVVAVLLAQVPEYQWSMYWSARVPREGQGAGRDKIYGKPTEGGILAPPPPQFETRPHFFPSHLQHFYGSNNLLMHWHLQYLLRL